MDKHYYPKECCYFLRREYIKGFDFTYRIVVREFRTIGKGCPTKFTNPNISFRTFRKERDVEQSHLAMSYPAISVKDQNYYSFITLNNIIGGNMSSRLFQEVREEKGLAYTIFSYPSCYMDVGALTIYGSTNNQQLPLLHETIIKSIEKIKKDGVTLQEL